ncbi:SigB/SigF/SigG family RNA polymerase sigma factor [Plantactinospora solaniradicis]|uniref:SigB/SigF/SigG family RNA polymerase sigma factor n=1 Tax=Plantactinospora solaniradicis TaxID=1723736 RepID=A0ABW1K936_9ACTN
MTVLAEPTLSTAVSVHPAEAAVPVASDPRQPFTSLRAVAPVRRTPPAYPPTSTEQLLRQLASLPARHPDRTRLRTRAIEENLPMANRLARRYAGRGELLDDLSQVAALALIKAVDGYDPGRQSPFVSYAVPTILGALKRHFRDTAWGMRVPRSAQELTREVGIATGELSQRWGRRPTPAELAEHLHVTVDALQVVIGARQVYHLASLNTPSSAATGVDRIDLLGGVDPHYAHVDDRLTLRLLLAALPPRERRILALRYYGQLTQTQIATEVGVSQMHVSRLLKQTLSRLRAAPEW